MINGLCVYQKKKVHYWYIGYYFLYIIYVYLQHTTSVQAFKTIVSEFYESFLNYMKICRLSKKCVDYLKKKSMQILNLYNNLEILKTNSLFYIFTCMYGTVRAMCMMWYTTLLSYMILYFTIFESNVIHKIKLAIRTGTHTV
jgi:hypothetical protein